MRSKLLISSMIVFTVLGARILFASELPLVKLHSNITLQGQRFYGDSFEPFGGYDAGPVSRYALRHATIGVSGDVSHYVEFDFTAGSATCLQGGGFTLMDAAVFYKPLDFLKVGFKKGEIMRGFELNQECVEVLTAEKPRFAKTFAPCHPLGAVLEVNHDVDTTIGLSLQFAYLDGQNQDLDLEHDMNVGAQIRTPIPGLSVGGFYSDIRKNYGPGADFEMVNDPGHRMGFGIDYDEHNLAFRSEMYLLKGFYNNPFSNTLFSDNEDSSTYIESKDLEMTAFFVEAGYTFHTKCERLPHVQPYVRYQSWDKASNADGDHLYSYLTCGMTFFLDQDQTTFFRVDYEERLQTPANAAQDAALLILRLQADFEWIL